jgi:hypothetical protein
VRCIACRVRPRSGNTLHRARTQRAGPRPGCGARTVRCRSRRAPCGGCPEPLELVVQLGAGGELDLVAGRCQRLHHGGPHRGRPNSLRTPHSEDWRRSSVRTQFGRERLDSVRTQFQSGRGGSVRTVLAGRCRWEHRPALGELAHQRRSIGPGRQLGQQRLDLALGLQGALVFHADNIGSDFSTSGDRTCSTPQPAMPFEASGPIARPVVQRLARHAHSCRRRPSPDEPSPKSVKRRTRENAERAYVRRLRNLTCRGSWLLPAVSRQGGGRLTPSHNPDVRTTTVSCLRFPPAEA